MFTDNVRPADAVRGIAPPKVAPTASDVVDRLVNLRPDESGSVLYDGEAALLLAVASSWAYSDAKTLSVMMARRGLPNNYCHHIRVSNDALLVDANAFLIQSECGRLAILCFRGTEPKNIIDWLTDASVDVDPFSSLGYVHGGFYRNVRAVWRDITARLDHARRGYAIHHEGAADGREETSNGHGSAAQSGSERKLDHELQALYITGHSLGAAMAAVAAAMICEDSTREEIRRALRGVYTFGQPMVGDVPFANKCERDFGKMVFRHVYDHDLVPRMPPRSTGHFKHFGQEYRSTDAGWMAKNRAVSQAYTALVSGSVGIAAWVKQQLPLVRRFKLPFSWDDHSPLHYMRCSQAVRPGSEFD